MFYIITGRVAVIHQKTHSYLEDLIRDEYFGEIGFFSDSPRCATVKSRDFTELFVIDSDTFLEVAEKFPEVMKIYHHIRTKLIEDFDYSVIQLECYICKEIGHMAIDCNSFGIEKQGNLIKLYNTFYKVRPQSRIRKTPIRRAS